MSSGRILRIEVENFKSYKGKQIIGPFVNFTCVIGPNGAGKSNLMDAISFVMGLRAYFLRSSNLKQLIYKSDSESANSAYVKLVFETKDKKEVHFMRTITESGGSEYKIDDVSVSSAKYQEKLKEFGILTKARNFLVFQGDVESIAAKSPMELTRLLEQVSGSDQYKKEYEELKEQKERANQFVITNFQKKKGITAEQNKYKMQKKEADRYDQLSEEHKNLQVEYILWRLYYIERDIREGVKASKEYAKELEKANKKKSTAEKQLGEKKKEYASVRKEQITLSKKMKKEEKKLKDQRASLAGISVKIQHLKSLLESNEKAKKGIEKQVENQKKEIALIEEQLRNTEEEQEKFEKQLEEEKKEELSLAEDQIEEYNKLKNKAGAETITYRQELEKIKSEQTSAEETLKNLEQKLEQLNERKRQLNEAIYQYDERLDKLQDIVDSSKRNLEQFEKEKQKIEEEINERRKRKEEINAKLLEIREELREARLERKENEREQQIRQAIESMKRLFQGVHGKLIDLHKVTNEKYTAAVTVAFGKHLNSIVVDNEKVAIECIEYLKEQRVSKCTFIPLETIKTTRINERLRTLGDEYKLAIDCIKFDEEYQKAFLYALGNTVICDTYDDASRLVFGDQPEKVKAVTLDGTAIHRSGMITGGLAEIEKQATKFKEKDVIDLKTKRDKLVLELQEIIVEETTSASSTTKLDADIGTLKNRIKYTQVDIEFTKKKKDSAEKEIEAIDEQLRETEPRKKQIEDIIKEKDEKIKELESKITEIEEKIFEEFSEKVGVENIRQYEATQLKAQQEATTRRSQFKILISRLKNQLEYEQKRDLESDLKKINETIERISKDLEKVKEEEKKLKNGIKEIEEKYDEQQRKLKELKEKMDDKHLEILEIQKIIKELTTQIQKQTRAQTAKDNEVEQARNRREEIYRRCKLEEIDLPTIEGEERPKKKRKVPKRRRRKKKEEESEEEEEEEEEEEDKMDIDEEEFIQSSEKFSVSQEKEQSAGRRTREEEVQLDFSSLSKDTLNLADKEYDKLEKDYKERLNNLISEIQELAPSLKSIDKLKSVNEKYESTVSELKHAKESSKEANRKFEEIKKKRLEAFMAAFTPISQKIDEIYKELTKSSKSPLGGTAYLGLESLDEPYLYGIKYNAMPPMKRYRDLELLSGGEKTVAALALLFAIHHFQPSPFFILDEIDAALDKSNVDKVARFISEKKKETQFLVISLKETFYTKADSLVGIYRDQEEKCSRTLTYDLTSHDKREEKEEEEEEVIEEESEDETQI